MELTGDLRNLDFSGMELAGIVFRDADLYRVSFEAANLEAAVFLNCFAAEASFAKANCMHVRAVQTSFYRAKMCGALLSGALFWNCVLAGADLRGAELRRVTITLDCNSFEETQIDRTTSAELAYLFGRARSAHRQGWLNIIGDRDITRLDRILSPQGT